jgi:hypothetical protein
MSDWQLRTPVAFLIFNRPDTTQRVFAEIAKAKPRKLLVIADGPRANREGEAERCAQARDVVDRVDWPCEVVQNYSDSNLGCRRRVSSGIDWVFRSTSEAIILEDDCVPHATFFRFCDELLERYRDDERIGMITGDNFQFGRRIADGSYYFSKYTHIWGWASWRRAWRHYDVDTKAWPLLLESGWLEQLTLPSERAAWKSIFERVHAGSIDTWDYQWTLACWANSMMSIVPQVNMITNIGFGPAATHTQAETAYANMKSEPMLWPLKEPSIMSVNTSADRATAARMVSTSLLRRLLGRARRMTGL